MRRSEWIRRIGGAVLILALAFGGEAGAEESTRASAGEPGKSRVSAGRERTAETEWVRGYRDGFELGYWTGLQDARALLPPKDRVPGYHAHIKATPYRDGYLAGYLSGYQQSFHRIWRTRP